MNFSAPFNIVVYSDGSKLELNNARNKVYTYVYVESKTKKGLKLDFKEEDLIKFLKNNEIFKPDDSNNTSNPDTKRKADKTSVVVLGKKVRNKNTHSKGGLDRNTLW